MGNEPSRIESRNSLWQLQLFQAHSSGVHSWSEEAGLQAAIAIWNYVLLYISKWRQRCWHFVAVSVGEECNNKLGWLPWGNCSCSSPLHNCCASKMVVYYFWLLAKRPQKSQSEKGKMANVLLCFAGNAKLLKKASQLFQNLITEPRRFCPSSIIQASSPSWGLWTVDRGLRIVARGQQLQ